MYLGNMNEDFRKATAATATTPRKTALKTTLKTTDGTEAKSAFAKFLIRLLWLRF